MCVWGGVDKERGKCLTKLIFLVIVICASKALWLVINVESIKNVFSIC